MRVAERLGGSRIARVPVDVVIRLVASLILAVALWSWVTTQRDPTETRTYTDVPIVAPQLAPPYEIAGEIGNAEIRLEGPRSVLDDILSADLEPRLDLGAIQGPGNYTLPVVLDVPAAVRVDRITPARLAVTVDQTATRTVHLDVEKKQPSDATRQIGDVVPAVSEVQVSGVQRLVDAVARVVLPVDIGNQTADFTGQFTAEARGSDGKPIPEVDIRPRRISATVSVQTRGRSVPVLIQTVGNPAPGYEVVDRVANPQTVVLDGPQATLDELVSVVTQPVDVEGATQPVSASIGLSGLPSGIQVVDPADGKVTAVVQIRERGVTQTLSGQMVSVIGAGPGLQLTADPPAVGVVIFAAEETLGTLRASDVSVQVSAAGLGPGTYPVRPQVAVPPEVQWIRTEPTTINLVVRPAPTTPSPDALDQLPVATPPASPPARSPATVADTTPATPAATAVPTALPQSGNR